MLKTIFNLSLVLFLLTNPLVFSHAAFIPPQTGGGDEVGPPRPIDPGDEPDPTPPDDKSPIHPTPKQPTPNRPAPTVDPELGPLNCSGNMDEPTLCDAVAVVFRIVSYVIVSAGLLLVFMIAYGAWKSAMALGDPKALQAAKQTWTYALYGFMVLVLFGVIFNIIVGYLLPSRTDVTLMGGLMSSLEKLIGNIVSP